MGKKILTVILAFAVFALASGVIYCDCALAEMIHPPQVEKQTGMDCHGETGGNGSTSSNECCGGCAVESLMPASQSFYLIQNHLTSLFHKNVLSGLFNVQAVTSIQNQERAPTAEFLASTFSIAQPLFILTQVFRL